ncbi:leucine-rich repeat-containing protein 23 [Thalassophryne amazonica]|uniref:leucine-rich repeat-containing protein 23 n=1 Tax=Thalassophryne amazonica TaxID=390379 RepID=UPI0014708C9A|nr:leucine-rich repeat-containing protein 23 [Thalassophryne amazonica]
MSDTEDSVLEGEEEKVGFCPREHVVHLSLQVQLRNLTQETIIKGLSLLCRTGNGLAHAFVKADLKNKGLSDISAISSYVHLRFVDVSNNHLCDLSPLASLTHLLWVKVDNNAVTSLKLKPLGQLTYLQWMSMAENQLTDLEGLVGPALENLNVSGNSIQRVDGLRTGCFDNLVTLELRGNQLDTTDGIYLPNLRRLYLAQNLIKRLEGLERLQHLTTLHLRDNQLVSLDGLSSNMKCMQYLNVRGNTISNQDALRCLASVSRSLQVLVLSENPVEEMADYRLCVLVYVPQLERLDKDLISDEERTEAKEIAEELK